MEAVEEAEAVEAVIISNIIIFIVMKMTMKK